MGAFTDWSRSLHLLELLHRFSLLGFVEQQKGVAANRSGSSPASHDDLQGDTP